MKFLIKYATRGRPYLFDRGIANIQNTISPNCDYKILVSADSDDATMIDYVGKEIKNTQIIFGNSKNKIEAINADMDKGITGEWDVLVNFSDDMEFIVSGWDKIIENDIISSFGNLDCFLHYNDGYVGDKLPTMSIMGKDYYDRFGYIYHPSYKTESCDAEAMYVAMMLGKHKYFDKILFKHEHPCNNGGVSDATYNLNGRYANADHTNYFERLKKYFYVENPVTLPFNTNDYR